MMIIVFDKVTHDYPKHVHNLKLSPGCDLAISKNSGSLNFSLTDDA